MAVEKAWSEDSIKAGVKVYFKNGGVGVLLKADTFISVPRSLDMYVIKDEYRNVFCPLIMTRDELVSFLNKEGYSPNPMVPYSER